MFKNYLWVFLEKSGQFIIQSISIIVLGRVLSPEDYGLYGTMMIFIAISELLIDSGFGGAIVHKKDVKQEDLNTLFVTNLSISLVLYLIIFCVAPFIAGYYNEQKLSLYLRVFGLVIILYSLTLIHVTMLQKELKFKLSTIIIFISSLVSVISAFIAALYGLGVWSLVIQQLLLSLTMVILLKILDKRKIRFEFSKSSFHYLWGFGSKLLFANFINTIYNNISTSLVPKITSMNIAGYYTQASKINSIPGNILMTTIDKVTFPLLSKENNSQTLFKKAQNINQIILVLTIPIFPIISLFSKEIIYVILGEKWIGADVFLAILAWGGIGLLLQTIYRNIFKSLADTSTILKVDLIKTIIGLTILGISLKLGVIFMIYGLTISMYIGAIVYTIILFKKFKVGIIHLISDYSLPLFVSLFIYIIFYFYMRDIHFAWYNLFYALAFYFIYFLVNLLLKNKIAINIVRYLFFK